jgi:hypothetical protein
MPVGMWAVMRHKDKAGKMQFARVHETEATAKEEARRLAAEALAGGSEHFAYYVIHVTGRIGFIGGVLQDFKD